MQNKLLLFSVYLALTSLPERVAYHFGTSSLHFSAKVSGTAVVNEPRCRSHGYIGYSNRYSGSILVRKRRRLQQHSHSRNSLSDPIKKLSIREKWKNYCESMSLKMKEFKFIADYIWPSGRDSVRLKVFLVIAMGFMYL
jgi:hypothetical protein